MEERGGGHKFSYILMVMNRSTAIFRLFILYYLMQTLLSALYTAHYQKGIHCCTDCIRQGFSSKNNNYDDMIKT